MYNDTADKLGIHLSHLGPSRTVFHGIVLGQSCSPIGFIRLDIIFGGNDNFRREGVWFEVVDHRSPYHDILGRPALVKFMAVPHYAYLMMKLRGPNGIISVKRDYKRSIACATAGSKMAKAMIVAEEFKDIKRSIEGEQPEVPGAKKQAGENQFQPGKDTKTIPLDASKPGERLVTIGATLTDK